MDGSAAMKQFWRDTSKMTDGELADLIHELNDELGQRCNKLPGSWLRQQLDAATLTVRSWSSAQQKAMKGAI